MYCRSDVDELTVSFTVALAEVSLLLSVDALMQTLNY